MQFRLSMAEWGGKPPPPPLCFLILLKNDIIET